MMEDIRDAIEKKRDLEIKNKEGATAVSLDYSCSKGTYHFFFCQSEVASWISQ